MEERMHCSEQCGQQESRAVGERVYGLGGVN